MVLSFQLDNYICNDVQELIYLLRTYVPLVLDLDLSIRIVASVPVKFVTNCV